MTDTRALKAEWDFEPDGEGYIYYPGPHSRGVRVTAAEREIFIHASTDEWLDLINDRERTEAPRPHWPAFLKRVRTTSPAFFFLIALAGFGALKQAYEGYTTLSTADSYAPLAVIANGLAALTASLGLFGLWVHWRDRRNVR